MKLSSKAPMDASENRTHDTRQLWVDNFGLKFEYPFVIIFLTKIKNTTSNLASVWLTSKLLISVSKNW